MYFSCITTPKHTGKDLVRRMLTVDPTKRISVDDAINHPWLNVCHADVIWLVTMRIQFIRSNACIFAQDAEVRALVHSTVTSYSTTPLSATVVYVFVYLSFACIYPNLINTLAHTGTHPQRSTDLSSTNQIHSQPSAPRSSQAGQMHAFSIHYVTHSCLFVCQQDQLKQTKNG